jgi:hypothetical protein
VDFWTAVVQLILTPALVVAAVTFMTKGLFSNLLARDLEGYKHRLAREDEMHKKLLEAAQFERQTRFSWAHQKQAEVIGQIYSKLADAHKKIELMTSPVQFGSIDRDLQRKTAADAYDALDHCFVTNRVFLSENRSEEVEKLITMMRFSFNQFTLVQHQQPNAENYKAAIEAWKRIAEEAKPVLTALRRDFRTVLTIDE